MDLPPTDVEVKREKFDEVNEAGPSFHCGLADTEIVHKIAQAFLPGLASACVDNTIGGLFKSPASVAVEIRKEMVEYLTQRSETFVAESVILEDGGEAEISDNPYDIISDFVDDFSSSKRNFFSRVSGWLLSDMREDRIDDFVQEMEINGFWFMERREAIAQTLLKNVDFKNTFHCDMKFNSEEELQGHTSQCSFRTMNCTNEGCNARFCAAQLENHDSACPFKILPCEQKCPQYIMRREMDKHCITLCTMKLVNCPFFPVGCQSTIPQCKIADHRSESLDSHLLYVLQVVHKGVSVKDLKKRAEQHIEAAYPGQLTDARDVRSLTFAVRGLEKNLGPLEITSETPPESPKEIEDRESATEKEGFLESPSKKEEPKESLDGKEEDRVSVTEKEGVVELASKKEELVKSPEKKEVDSSSSGDERTDSPTNKEELSTEKEKSEDSPVKKEESTESPAKKVESNNSSPKAEERDASSSEKGDSPTKKEESPDSPLEEEERPKSPPSKEKSNESSPKHDKSDDSSSEKEDSPTRKEAHPDSPPKKEEFTESSPKKVESNESSPKSKDHDDSSSEKGDSPTRKEELPNLQEHTESPPKKEKSEESSPKVEESDGSSSEKEHSPTRKEGHTDSPTKEDD